MESIVSVVICEPPAGFQGCIALRSGLKKKDGRQELVFSEYPDDLAEWGRLPPMRHSSLLIFEKIVDLAVESFFFQVGHDAPGRVEKKRIERDRSFLFPHNNTFLPSYHGEPLCDLIAIAYSSGEQK